MPGTIKVFVTSAARGLIANSAPSCPQGRKSGRTLGLVALTIAFEFAPKESHVLPEEGLSAGDGNSSGCLHPPQIKTA